MIELTGVTKKYGVRRVVDAVSVSVSRGEVMGLLGPNGAGKTTLMRMITGYLPPSEGQVMIAGKDMYDQPEEVKKKIGYLPEHPPLYLDMTVREYLEFTGHIRGLSGRAAKTGAGKAAELCGIADMLGRLIGNLSKGYRQRVGLAQALIHSPEVLVLDEPTVGLDPRQMIEIRELIRRLGRNSTIILSSHILQEVTEICTAVAIINHGRLVATDRLDRISGVGLNRRKIVVSVAHPESLRMERLEAIPGVISVEMASSGRYEIWTDLPRESAGKAVAEELVHMGAGLTELREVQESLEDIFLRLVSAKAQA